MKAPKDLQSLIGTAVEKVLSGRITDVEESPQRAVLYVTWDNLGTYQRDGVTGERIEDFHRAKKKKRKR